MCTYVWVHFFAASEYTTNQPTHIVSVSNASICVICFILLSIYLFPIFSLSAFYNDFSWISFFQSSISFPFQCIFPHVCCIFFYKLEIFSFFSLSFHFLSLIVELSFRSSLVGFDVANVEKKKYFVQCLVISMLSKWVGFFFHTTN